MKALQITLFILFAGTLSIQGVRHLHLYFYGMEESIVAPYEEFFGMEKEIQLEASTEELLAEYEASQEDISQLRDAFPTKEQFELQAENKELFARNQALRNELQQREGVAPSASGRRRRHGCRYGHARNEARARTR